MAESNIFDIIRRERLNICDIDTNNINKVFLKFYFKYMLLIKKKLQGQKEINFEEDIDAISNMFFHISWIILLTSFNIHIAIFFMERAALLFSEFIIISSSEPKYVLDTNNKLNDAIIFTYNKTVGETVIDRILKENISILHCNTEYPTPMKDVNLKAMLSIRDKFDVEIGYSDHTLGVEIPIAAVALGAKIIEKHFTLDRTLLGPDHAASLEPKELKAMVNAIRNIEIAMSGDGEKTPSESEMKNISIARKSIHVNKNLSKGDVISEKDIIALRPGDGISPMEWNTIIGKKIKVKKNKFDKLFYSDFT